MDANQQYYLVVKPISELRSDVEPRLDELSRITGMDKTTLAQRFTGAAMQVLKASTSQEELNKISGELSDATVFSAVVAKNDLSRFGGAVRIKSIERAKGYVKLFTSENNREEFRIDNTKKCIIVLSTPSHGRIQSKRLARTALNDGSPLPPYETLSTIFRNNPVMDIFVEGISRPLRIDSTRFNYNSLGDENRGAAALNFPFMLKEIQRVAESVTLETGYGENDLPFLSLNEEEESREGFLREFSKYSAFVALTFADGIFTIPAAYGGILEMPVIKELGSILWGGPLIQTGKAKDSKEKEDRLRTPKRSSLKPPPEPPVKVSLRRNPIGSFAKVATRYGIHLRTLGPPFVIYPLSLLTVLSVALSSLINSLSLLPVAAVPFGLILFTHAFTLINRKHTIENCPTSRIKTMAMGEVEVMGRTRAKYYLRAPFSMTECAYYSYKLYEQVQTKDGPREMLREFGHSGNVPFYLEDLEDKDERTIILPTDAIIKAGRTETFHGDALTGILMGHSSSSNRRVVETTIPTGGKLYIMGFAHRLIETRAERRKPFTDKIKALKNDRALLLKKYDTDHDGKLDEKDWATAVKDLEDEALFERLHARKKDDIAIGRHPTGGLFYISNRHEKSIIGSMSWRIPLFLILGIAGTSLGGLYILKLLSNKAILDRLLAFFN